jgi:hypothetical protein
MTGYMSLISVPQIGALFLLVNYVSRRADAICAVTLPTVTYHIVACCGHIDLGEGDRRFVKLGF